AHLQPRPADGRAPPEPPAARARAAATPRRPPGPRPRRARQPRHPPPPPPPRAPPPARRAPPRAPRAAPRAPPPLARRAAPVDALGHDPAAEGLQITTAGGEDPNITRKVNEAISEHRVLEFEYYKENEDEFTHRHVEPYALMNAQTQGWYVHCWDLDRDAPRS